VTEETAATGATAEAAEPAGTAGRADPPGLDLAALAAHLDHGPLSGELVSGGRSNLTYLVCDERRSWIVRRPPLGHVLATAHDMAREYRVMSALAPTDVPVPETYVLCEDPEVLGAPFYVMQNVVGHVYRTAASAAELGMTRLTAMAASSPRCWPGCTRWTPRRSASATSAVLRATSAGSSRAGASSSPPPAAANCPASTSCATGWPRACRTRPRSAIVHGDYRLDNVIFGDDDRIAAVVDWEMATLGDPLTDIGALLLYWEMMVSGQGLFGDVPRAPRSPALRPSPSATPRRAGPSSSRSSSSAATRSSPKEPTWTSATRRWPRSWAAAPGSAPEAMNCSAPGHRQHGGADQFGTPEQKEQWLRPLLDGEIRSAFCMTEPEVASSDATNIETRIERKDGDEYVINGRKWYASGAMNPRADLHRDGQDRPEARPIAAVDDPGAARHARGRDRAADDGLRLRRRAARRPRRGPVHRRARAGSRT
jgi:hypothetical protein